MRTAATIFVLLAACVAVWWFIVRPLRQQWRDYRVLHSTLSNVDATLWFRVKMSLKGLRTIIFNTLIIITGFMLSALELIGTISIAAVLPPIDLGPLHATPEQYLMILNASFSAINVWLRKVSNTPAGSPVAAEEAVVEVPTVVGKPDVAIVSAGSDVVAVADTVKSHAVATGSESETPSVAEVVKASTAGETVVLQAKEPG